MSWIDDLKRGLIDSDKLMVPPLPAEAPLSDTLEERPAVEQDAIPPPTIYWVKNKQGVCAQMVTMDDLAPVLGEMAHFLQRITPQDPKSSLSTAKRRLETVLAVMQSAT